MATVITGMAATLRNIEKAKAAAVKGAERGVDRARLAVETTAKKLIMKGPKTGYNYFRVFKNGYMIIINADETVWSEKKGEIEKVVAIYKSNGPANLSPYHRASAPGESPATDTGTLANSIESKRYGLVAVVWTEKKYAKWLEFGTRKIAPRPFFTPAVEQNREKYPTELGNAVVEAINQAVKQ